MWGEVVVVCVCARVCMGHAPLLDWIAFSTHGCQMRWCGVWVWKKCFGPGLKTELIPTLLPSSQTSEVYPQRGVDQPSSPPWSQSLGRGWVEQGRNVETGKEGGCQMIGWGCETKTAFTQDVGVAIELNGKAFSVKVKGWAISSCIPVSGRTLLREAFIRH